ncbi:MAG: sigma-70 family RNA polymerase sigma factor [Muribaculaceae bacterium]|nr:sigma-70 family RNA polymerase sigma factor [Muribaculaceae bacterium]
MNPQTFKRLVLPLAGSLYVTALRITGSAADAEDAVQESMARLWERRRELATTVGSVEAYAAAIVRNCAIDLMKRRSRFVSVDTPEADSADPMTPDRELEERDDVRLLLEAIDTLSSAQAAVVRMRHIEGLDPAQIEAATGLSAVNIRVILHRARISIKKYFNQRR